MVEICAKIDFFKKKMDKFCFRYFKFGLFLEKRKEKE